MGAKGTRRRVRIHQPTQHEINRIIVGNQIHIMRMLDAASVHSTGSAARIHNIKDWWRRKFDEEVGFKSGFGDEPIKPEPRG